MSEQATMKDLANPNTKASIIEALKQLGLKQGDRVLVHSSLSSLGWVCGREQAVVEALKAVVTSEGTIVMPAFSGDFGNPQLWQNPPVPASWIEIIKQELPAYNPNTTPLREMGKIAECFCFSKDTLRFSHPLVSFSAWGKDAKMIVSNHPLSPGFGKDSPLQRLYDYQAKVLLLGVGYSNCTCLHLSEVRLDGPKILQGSAIMVDGKRQWVQFEEYDYDDGDFEALGKDYEKDHHVSIGQVGKAKARLIDMKKLCDFGYLWLRQHRNMEEKND